jgi:hypothetical protein
VSGYRGLTSAEERLREYERLALVELLRSAIEGDGMAAGKTTDPATVATRLLNTNRLVVLPRPVSGPIVASIEESPR